MKVFPPALRLFPDADRSHLELDSSEAFVVTRLLEAGDSSDLEALFSQCSESSVRRLFEQRGGRQLDRRSRAFWSLLLAVEPTEGHPLSEELWAL